MVSKFCDVYSVILRLVVIMLLFAMDNSDNERDFSLMNDLKSPLQHAMVMAIM